MRSRYLLDSVATHGKAGLKTLYRRPVILAGRLRRRLTRGVRFVAVTGSSGKTTTKDLIRAALAERVEVHASPDSNNGLFSVARTLVALPRRASVCVQEVGLSDRDDLGDSVRLLAPDVGVVTAVAAEHYKTYRTLQDVAREKAKLVAALPPDGTAVLNFDDDHVRAMSSAAPCRVLSFGRGEDCDLRAVAVTSDWPDRLRLTVTYEGRTAECATQLCGEHLASCVLAALATCLALGLSLDEAAARGPSFEATPARMMPVVTPDGITFIRDDWKAPYWSIEAPIRFMARASARRKLIVLGTLSDYSGTSRKKYARASKAALAAADHVYLVGPNAHKGLRVGEAADASDLKAFATVGELARHLRETLRPGDLVLLKGSGADHLARLALMYERDVRCWRERCGRENLCDYCRLLSVS